MSATPAIRLVAWEDRGNTCVFVAIPNERGRYLRTDHSVVLVECPACRSVKGEPCTSRQGYSGGTHAVRRTKAQAYLRGELDLRGPVRVDDWIVPVEKGEPSVPQFEPPPAAPLPEVIVRPKPGFLAKVRRAINLLDEPRPL